MFESNLLSQINLQSPLPTFVETEVIDSINGSLQKAFQFGHVLLAERSHLVARALPWSDEVFYSLMALWERFLLFRADTTFVPLMFGLRYSELIGPTAQGPPRPSLPDTGSVLSMWASVWAHRGRWKRYVRWLLCGPAPMLTPEQRAMDLVNGGRTAGGDDNNSSTAASHGGGSSSSNDSVAAAAAAVVGSSPDTALAASAAKIEDSTIDGSAAGEFARAAVNEGENAGATGRETALAQLNAEELLSANQAAYGHLRFGPLSPAKKYLAVVLLTLKPYLEKKLMDWYREQTDDAADAVAYRTAYSLRYPQRAALRAFLVRYLVPFYHVTSQSLELLFKLLYLLELTPYPSYLHRLGGIALRRSTMRDSLVAAHPHVRRALLYARVLLLLIFFGFRVLEYSRNNNNNATGVGGGNSALADEDLPIPPPPAWGSDVPAPQTLKREANGALSLGPEPVQPAPGVCPVCERRVTNAAVCTASGVVGCYPCMQNHLREHRRCPVTGKSATVEQLRRVYEC